MNRTKRALAAAAATVALVATAIVGPTVDLTPHPGEAPAASAEARWGQSAYCGHGSRYTWGWVEHYQRGLWNLTGHYHVVRDVPTVPWVGSAHTHQYKCGKRLGPNRYSHY